MKGSRGGKYAGSSSAGSSSDNIRRHKKKEQSGSGWTYNFYSAKLGAHSYPGNNKEDALAKARRDGYKASDLVDRDRR